MNSHKKVQTGASVSLGVTQYGATHSALMSERLALVELLQRHLAIARELHGYVRSLELRSRNVSFVDVRQLFHRIGEATDHCATFLADRIHDLSSLSGARPSLTESALPDWYDVSFAACLQHIAVRTTALGQFALQSKSFMDKAVINGDYNTLHVMTDCIYQISQLVALIQIHLPPETTTANEQAATPQRRL